MTRSRKRTSWIKTVVQIALCILVLALGILSARALIRARATPPREEQDYPGPLVMVTTVTARDVPVAIRGHGTVEPRLEVELVPQVSGTVTAVHESLVAGGFFSAGDVLIEIDRADYELGVRRARAAVERARVTVKTERAEAAVARAEWESLYPNTEPPSALVLREPQVERAEAELSGAEADLAQAELNLTRTRLTLPFDGRVVSERVDPGQYVVAGQPVAAVYGTAVAEIRVPLEDRDLKGFTLPITGGGGAPDNGGGGSVPATVRATFQGAEHTWAGCLARTEAQLDPRSRMVYAVIEVGEPFARVAARPPLVPGMFVEVEIEGPTLRQVVTIPRHALREGRTAWTVEDGRLRIRPVTVERRDRDLVHISAGIDPGTLVVTSALDAVTDGMRVRPHGAGETRAPTASRDTVPAKTSARASAPEAGTE